MTDATELIERQSERAKVESWRLHVLIEAGYPLPLAEKLAAKGLLAGYLKDDLLFRDADVKSVQSNLALLAAAFRQNCRAGKLRLDADIAQYLGAKPKVDSVAVCNAN